MVVYAIRRILIAVPVLFGITVVTFLVITLAPGSPLDLLVDPNMSAEQLEQQRQALGFDRPVYVQYVSWLTELLRGNLGHSFASNRPVAEMIVARLPATLLLSATAIVLAYGVAVPLGAVAATRAYTVWDYGSMVVAFLGAATPSFFLGLLGIYFFSVQLGVLPLGGMVPTTGADTLGARLAHLVMPAAVLAAGQMGSVIRFVRSGMLELLHDDYVRTARAKGLSERVVVYKHVLRNALIPVVTMVGLSLPFLVGGAVIVEQVFTWPGIGTLLIRSINMRDYPVIMGLTMLVSIAVLIGNLLADLAYGWIDPRVRYS